VVSRVSVGQQATRKRPGSTVSELANHRLHGISPKAYEHPADRAATAALASVPGLNMVVRKLVEYQYERVMRQTLIASAVRVGSDQLPDLWLQYELARATLDVDEVYDLYVTHQPIANAFTMGAGRPVIVLNSGLVSLLEPDELRTVIGHELGHILSRHVEYSTALAVLIQLGLGGMPRLAGLPIRAVRAALLEWYRAAELTCDRAATLVNRDPLVTSRTLMVIASGMPSSQLNLDAFLRQGSEYERWSSAWDRLSRFRIELQLMHDVPVRRVSELMLWIRSGAYDRIIGGSFTTRDREPNPREHADDAVRHYTERFKRIFQDAGATLGDTTEKMSDWLDRE
jgi:Zn-dependent protease with chaperone function